MLVLSRKQGERIKIGDGIEIVIVDIGQGNVKIGIEAPKDVKVVRSELLDALKEQNKEASLTSLEMLKSFKGRG